MSVLNLAELGIMIVDDQQAARGMLKKMLKELQIHQVFEASNGREALKLLDSAPDMINLILCDWNMANVSGIELLRQVRSVRSEVPFLMVTGRADRESVLEAKDAGVSGYISKPFSQIQLEAKIRVVLSNRPAN
jgi:two-component system chemotaxis response regulator CheY